MYISVVILLIFIISNVINTKIKTKLSYNSLFTEFMKKYKKIYHNEEELNYRFTLFKNKVDQIELHNSKKSSYKLGINQFSDLTTEEFKTKYMYNIMNNNKNLKGRMNKNINKNKYNNIKDIPEEIDWTKLGAVTEVKNQGKECASDYAFSTTGTIESEYFLKYNKTLLLSEQYIVDCSLSYGNSGCEGGSMRATYGFVVENGICLESDYPYHGIDEQCKDICKKALYLTHWEYVDPVEPALAIAVSNRPISVAVNIAPLQDYESGIYDDLCDSDINHGALVVGYGVDYDIDVNGTKFWKIKNSWGKEWGEDGYFRLIKDTGEYDGRCGIAISTSYAVL